PHKDRGQICLRGARGCCRDGAVSDPDRRYLAYFLGTAPGGKALRPLPYLAAAGAVVLALAGGLAIERYLGAQSVLLLFLMAILASAVTRGLFPPLLAVVLSVLTYNFFFLSPIYTFAIAEPENAVALVFFFLVAVVASSLAAATRSQTEIARARAETNAALYNFSGKLAATGTLDEVLWATAYQIASMLRARIVLLMPQSEGGKLGVAGGYPPEDRLDGAAMAAIERVTLAGAVAEARVLAETERLRSALLTSISHDLRTPLASIIGVVS